MKKKLALAVSLLAVFIWAEGQKPDTAWLMVHYKFTHVRDTSNREHPYTENTVLFVGRSASAYRSYDGLIADRQFKKVYAEAVAGSPDGRPMIQRKGVGSFTQYFQYPGEHKLFTRAMAVGSEYVVQDAMPVIDWTISVDTETFYGLHCQKATCHFKGRDYIAWFCPDLPVHTGPWKLNGLPGVIVDAHDTKNEVIFQLDGVEKTAPSSTKDNATAKNDEKDVPAILLGLDDDPNVIEPPARGIKTTQEQFDKLLAAVRKNPDAVAQSVNSEPGRGIDPNKPLIHENRGPGISNPIELPEK
jgi:GLPGLI family protein